MNSQADNLKNLFSSADNTRFGCVMFDLQDNGSGENVPMPGSGWASIEGRTAYRVKSVNELNNDVKWLTNLTQNTLWKTGAVKHNKLKHSTYLRTDLGQIMKEIGTVPPNTPIAEVCEIVSGIFNKTMLFAVQLFGLDSFTQKELHSELKSKLLGEDRSISVHVDEALSRTYQDLVICENFATNNNSDTVFVTLKRPRVVHAKEILAMPIPLSVGDWDFISPDQLLGNSADKIKYLNAIGKPFIAKCSISSYFYSKDLNVDLSKLLTLGEAFAEGGKTKERNWVCQPELNYLTTFSDIDVSAAFVAQGQQSLFENLTIPFLGDLQDFSYSFSLLMENLWVSYASRSLNPRTKVKSLVSPRASWLKAADRFLTLKSAMLLSSFGHHVVSYGYGSVNLQVPHNKVKDLIDLAPSAGLIVPINIIDRFVDKS